jgi:hypothetical protein
LFSVGPIVSQALSPPGIIWASGCEIVANAKGGDA